MTPPRAAPVECDEAEPAHRVTEQEQRDATRRQVGCIAAFMAGWDCAVSLRKNPRRDEVLSALDDYDRARFPAHREATARRLSHQGACGIAGRDAGASRRCAMTPTRVQRKRSKGWRQPAGAVYVGRPTRWGNPFSVERYGRYEAVRLHREWLLAQPALVADVHRELAGRDVACWCPLDQECHGDLLLEIANGGTR